MVWGSREVEKHLTLMDIFYNIRLVVGLIGSRNIFQYFWR